MKIGQLIKEEIKKKGLTQKEIAKIIGKSETAISQIVIGNYNPTQSTIDKICEVLNIEIKFYAIDKTTEKGCPFDEDLYSK